MATHFHLPTTLRLEHKAHVLPLPRLPLSLTPVLPVIFILTAEISPHSIPLLPGLSMDLEKEAGQLKVAAKPNCLPSSLPVAVPILSYRVHASCHTPHQHSYLSCVLTKWTCAPYPVTDGVLLSRNWTMANSSIVC